MRAIILYATREGHTRRIAEHIADQLRLHHAEADLCDVRDRSSSIDWSRYDWACVAASVHLGRHEREMVAFVNAHRARLETLDAAFLSVTLSEVGAEDPRASAEDRAKSSTDVRRMIDGFLQETGWRPAHILPVAGALAYSRYNFIVRFVMKRIARKAGAPTDPSRDYEFTDWTRLDRFIEEASARAGTASVELKAR